MTAVTLGLVALTLVLLVIGLAWLVRVLDAAELTLRMLVTGVRAARRAVESAGSLAGAVERDSAGSAARLTRLEDLKQPEEKRPS